MSEESQIQMPTVIRWVIANATCVVVLNATTSVFLTERNCRVLASSDHNAAMLLALPLLLS